MCVNVPRLLNRFVDHFKRKLSALSPAEREKADEAIAEKLKTVNETGQYTHTIYDNTFFNRFSKVLGGRMRLMVTGAAPINSEV